MSSNFIFVWNYLQKKVSFYFHTLDLSWNLILVMKHKPTLKHFEKPNMHIIKENKFCHLGRTVKVRPNFYVRSRRSLIHICIMYVPWNQLIKIILLTFVAYGDFLASFDIFPCFDFHRQISLVPIFFVPINIEKGIGTAGVVKSRHFQANNFGVC